MGAAPSSESDLNVTNNIVVSSIVSAVSTNSSTQNNTNILNIFNASGVHVGMQSIKTSIDTRLVSQLTNNVDMQSSIAANIEQSLKDTVKLGLDVSKNDLHDTITNALNTAVTNQTVNTLSSMMTNTNEINIHDVDGVKVDGQTIAVSVIQTIASDISNTIVSTATNDTTQSQKTDSSVDNNPLDGLMSGLWKILAAGACIILLIIVGIAMMFGGGGGGNSDIQALLKEGMESDMELKRAETEARIAELREKQEERKKNKGRVIDETTKGGFYAINI